MNFKEATDALFRRISHEQLAEALGVSVASIRQARLAPTAKAYREAPRKWERAALSLAKQHAEHYKRLVETLERGCKSGRSVTR